MRQLFTALFVCFFLSSAVAQSIVYVTPTGSGNQSGGSWSDALSGTQLQPRLASASAGTQFWIAGGSYKPTIGTDRTLSFFIPSGVQVYGGFTGTETTLSNRKATRPYSTIFSGYLVAGNDEQNSYHVVTFRNANADTRLDGVSIIYGRANGTSDFNNVGAGVYNDGSNGGRSEPVFSNCEIRGNNADSNGGGVYNNGRYGVCSSRFVNCSIEGNSSNNGNGGGMYNDGFQGICSPQLTNCILASNRAAQGSAITSDGSQGLSSPVIANCVFKYNYGGSVLHGRGFNGNCQPSIVNSILWTNSRPSFYSESANHLVTYSDIEDGYSGTGNISQDPQFFNYYTNDFRLLKASPAIDAGNPNSTASSISATDYEGKSRFYNNRIDMGIIEYVPNSVTGIVRVTIAGSGDNVSGNSWGNALNGYTMRAALSEAAPGTSFWVAGGSYFPSFTTGDRSSSFVIPPGVKVYGGFAGNETDFSNRVLTQPLSTTLSGDVGITNDTRDNSYRVVVLKNATAETVLDGFVITGGNANGSTLSDPSSGAGIYCDGRGQNNKSEPKISNCLVIGNTARSYGGGMHADGNYGNASPTLINCQFVQNTASSGGGAYNGGLPGLCSPTYINCTFLNNTATDQGGGIYYYTYFRPGDNTFSLSNCTISGNRATDGAGLYCGNSSDAYLKLVLTNCLIDRNTASGLGGGLYLYRVGRSTIEAAITNCTLANNRVGNAGDNIFNHTGADTKGRYAIKNSIVKNGGFGYRDDGSGSTVYPPLDITYSNVQALAYGSTNIDVDPLFVDPVNGNFRLKAGSPSINTGDPNSTMATVSATDLAGNKRVAESRIDMGAYEFQASASTGSDLSMSLRVDNRTAGVGQTITYRLTVTNDGPSTATGVVWQHRLPDNVQYVGGTTLSVENGIVTGNLGTLLAGESVTAMYQLQASQPGQYISAAQITAADQPDPDSQPNSGTGDGQDDAAQVDIRVGGANSPVYASANPNQVPLPPTQSNQPTPDPGKVDLALSISVDNRVPRPGDLLTYVLTITNQGGTTASNVRVTAYLPDGQQFEASGDGLSVSDGGVSGGTASIPAGGQTSVRFTARVTASKMGITKAQIRQASPADVDSTPDNGTDNGEDDTAQIDLRSLTGL
ncbi:choice-of-anchor Q domain-containing protein [Spirosoma rhododendri]|uniref:DUF11 domain-containing protein n=1 Tax=Spirosoma rhododendri TaxID=2728024 RepID=A0A7L5DZP0_9BACT|nr:choice-of-anchor Q domain-containing protein [Spirosoma rhododendri]QJD80970.1 DUF11 domain-containing protein [Spirosoma rhododendri]